MGNDGRHDSIVDAAGSSVREITRRDLLKVVGAGAGVAALAPIIAACGGGQRASQGGASPSAPGAVSPSAAASGASPSGSAAASGASPSGSAGAIQPPAANVSLDFWNPFTGGDGPFLRTLVDQFNKETPTVQVKFTTQKDLYGSLQAAKAANRLPHVSVIHLDQIPQQAENKVFQPIDDLIQTLGLSGEQFTEDVWRNGEWKGSRYGVPLDIHTMNFYWNKKLLRDAGLDPEKPPATQEEFVNAAKTITQKGTAPGYMVVQAGPGANFLVGIQFATFYYQQGGTWLTEDGSAVAFDSDKAVTAANFLKSLVDQQISPKNVESDSEIAAFQQGKNAMVMSGIWTTNAYAKALGQDLGAAAVPKLFGEGVWAGSHHLGVPARANMSADEKQGAYYFINWLTTHSLDWAKAGQIPASASVREDPAFKDVPYIPAFAEQVPAARFLPAVPGSPSWLFDAGGAGEATVNVITGRAADPKAAYETVKGNLTKKFQDAKSKFGF